jgi:TonB family protein
LIVLFLLLSVVAFSQTTGDAKRLLQQVADSAKSTEHWRIEGSVERQGSKSTTTEHFRVLTRMPNEVRFELDGRSTPAVIVCDGVNAWIYSPPLLRYKQEPAAGNKLCSPIVGDWNLLPANLDSPVFAGACGPDPSTYFAGYVLVRGFAQPELTSSGRITRSLCIDKEKKEVVWERWENKYETRVYRYSVLDRNAEIGGDAFVFNPPAGSARTDFELPIPRPMGSRGMTSGVGVTPPRIISKKEPEYGNSRKAEIEGVVYLYVVVGADGAPAEVTVFGPVSPDLDAAAVKAVKQWRFTPGSYDGKAVPLAAVIEIDFRLL